MGWKNGYSCINSESGVDAGGGKTRTSTSLSPFIPPAAGPCWRRPAGKALIHRRTTPTGRSESRSAPAHVGAHPAGKTLVHRRATPTGRLESRPPPAHVGAAPPAKPYPTVGPRQQDAPNPAQRLPMLAPPRRQSLIPPSGHANRTPRIPLAAGPCWRRPADNPLSHRRTTPTGRSESRSAPAHVGAALFKSKFSRDSRYKSEK